MTMPEITLTSGLAFKAEPEMSILEAAAKAGVVLPYSCKTGRCSTCKCKVVRGETRVLVAETGLSEQEKREGWILSCARSAAAEVVLEASDLGGITLPPNRTLPCRISSLDRLASDVIRVGLRLPPTADFDYVPGQYIDVIGHGGIRRSYSVANACRHDKQLELHVRAVDGGVMSRYWFNEAKANDLLRLNGPHGTFFLRNAPEIDVVFLATGTGIAPVKAILESMIELPEMQRPRSVVVFWGGRTPEDLYFDVASLPGNHIYVPVLSRAGADWSGVRGHVQQALLDSQLDLSNCAVYACGSGAMIRGAKEALTQAGLPSGRFYSDEFVCSATN